MSGTLNQFENGKSQRIAIVNLEFLFVCLFCLWSYYNRIKGTEKGAAI